MNQGSTGGAMTAVGWLLLGGLVVVLLGVDLWTCRGERAESRRTTFLWSVVWVLAGLAFGGVVWALKDGRSAWEYYAAYAMEKGLSLDNLFLFYVIFHNLSIPGRAQRRVLFWGILGAVVFRGLFIFAGVAAIERWEWVTYLFAAILLYAAWRALREDPSQTEKSRLVEALSRRLPVTQEMGKSGSAFLVRRETGGWAATKLLVALVAIELTDVMFAIDSVPAALSITHDRFVVFSSNIFAILGLRALYLFLAATLTQLRYLHYGLAAVLAFAALKIATRSVVHIPPLVSLAIIVFILGVAVWASLRARRREGKEAER